MVDDISDELAAECFVKVKRRDLKAVAKQRISETWLASPLKIREDQSMTKQIKLPKKKYDSQRSSENSSKSANDRILCLENAMPQHSIELPHAEDTKRIRSSWTRLNIAQNISIPLGNEASYDSCDTMSEHHMSEER